MSRTILNRMSILCVVFFIAFLLLLGKLVHIQIIKAEELRQQALFAQNRYINSEEYPRGDIVDNQGRSLLGSTEILKEILITEDRRIHTADDRHEFIEISDAKNGYPYTVPIKQRYGEDSLARHLIGHLIDGHGANGLERLYNEYLISQPKIQLQVVLDARGNIVPGLSFKEVERIVPRNTLYLTIDKNIQQMVEEVMDEYHVEGSVVVMNPRNGDLIALASRPNYNQRNNTSTNQDNFLNKSFAHYYPGSLFKILIGAAALEEGLISPLDRLICTGEYNFPTGLSIPCWNRNGHGNISVLEAMAFSCNPSFIEIGLKLGRNNILKYSQKLGLMENKIIGYPQNIVNKINIDYGPGAIGNASLGQEGIMITPVQSAVLVSSIANGGYVVTPRIVKEIKNENGEVIFTPNIDEPSKVWSDSTVNELNKMLHAVTIWGTGTKAWSADIASAGKTASAETGSGTNALFGGYFPFENPKYTIVVLVEGGSAGGVDAAPIFKIIMEKINNI